MENNIKKGVVTKTTKSEKELIINQLNVVSADRSKKDIGDFKSALQSAESVHYPNRTRLQDLYKDIILDGHLSGIISKRIDAVLNKAIHFEDKQGKRIDAFNDLLESLEFREVLRKILETPFYGLSGLEFIPGTKFQFEEIPRKHIKPNKGIIATEQNGDSGFDYVGVPNLWITGQKDDLGLLLKCAPYAIWKRGALADWSQYIELFGQPVRIIYYDAYDEKTKIELKQVLDESGSSLALMIPKQADFQMMDGKQANGTGELQERFKKTCDDEMSVIILTNTETTTSSKSSGYAQSQTHATQQLEITKSDIKYATAMLNSEQFLSILKSYGYPVTGGKFVFEKEIDLNSIKTQVDIIDVVKNKLGTPVSDDHIYDVTGIPKPDDYEAQKEELRVKSLEVQSSNSKVQNTKEEPPKEPQNNAQKPLKPKQKTLNSKRSTLNLFDRLRTTIADFFDQPL